MKQTKKLLFLLCLSGCTSNMLQKLSTVGEPAQLSHIIDPTQVKGYKPITMPMPEAQQLNFQHTNSLWQTGSRAFFKDQRANKVGDIVTVKITVDQKESMEMKPTITRENKSTNTVTKALGLERKVEKFFPKKQSDGINPNPQWIEVNSKPSLSGGAKYDITDKLNVTIAATVIQILPNGNMVIQGRQELGLVNEVREIEVKGIVRREDINSDNSVSENKIAEMRVMYGGRGELTEMQSFPWGQQVINKVMPF
jgi:flagellar L-ring protein FlgH